MKYVPAFFTRLGGALLFAAVMFSAASADDVADADRIATQLVISDQIAAFKAGDHERAYSYAAPVVKSVFPTVERFISMVQGGYMPLYRPESYVFGRNTLIGEEVHQELIVTDEAGKTWQAVYSLRKQEDGSWKVTGVKMNPYKGASA